MSHEQLKQRIRQAVQDTAYQKAINRISLFGSHLHKDAKPDSDIDLLIEFSPEAIIGLFQLVDIKQQLEKYLKNEVDLLTPEGLSPYFRSDVIKEALLLYER